MGILFSIAGTWFVRISDSAGINTSSVQKALNMGNWGSIVLLQLLLQVLFIGYCLNQWYFADMSLQKWDVLGAIVVGLGSWYIDEHYY